MTNVTYSTAPEGVFWAVIGTSAPQRCMKFDGSLLLFGPRSQIPLAGHLEAVRGSRLRALGYNLNAVDHNAYRTTSEARVVERPESPPILPMLPGFTDPALSDDPHVGEEPAVVWIEFAGQDSNDSVGPIRAIRPGAEIPGEASSIRMYCTFGHAENYRRSGNGVSPAVREYLSGLGYAVSEDLRQWWVRPALAREVPAPAQPSLLPMRDGLPDPALPRPALPDGMIWVSVPESGGVYGGAGGRVLRCLVGDSGGGATRTLIGTEDEMPQGHSIQHSTSTWLRQRLTEAGLDFTDLRYWVCASSERDRVVEVASGPAIEPEPEPESYEPTEQHLADIATIGRMLIEEAEERSWCGEYDDVIRRINRCLTVSLPRRNGDYRLVYTTQQEGTVTAQFTTPPTDEQAQGALPAGATLLRVEPLS